MEKLKSKQIQQDELSSDRSDSRPMQDRIQNDVYNVVKIGSMEFKQLPVIDQARLFLMKQKSSAKFENTTDYVNTKQLKGRL